MPLKRYSIGRALDCDVVLADPSISRRHAELEVGDDLVTLVDCNSTHGTKIVEADRTRSVMREAVEPMTTVQLGELTLTVEDLLEAVRARDARASHAEPAPSREIRPARGSKLIRCECGVIKPKNAVCPGCGL